MEIGNPEIKLNLLNKIQNSNTCCVGAYVSPTAQIMPGTTVESMAIINTGLVISIGCIIGARVW